MKENAGRQTGSLRDAVRLHTKKRRSGLSGRCICVPETALSAGTVHAAQQMGVRI